MNPNDHTKSHIHYNKQDKEIRAKEEYEKIRNNLQSIINVNKYKTDLLEINLTCKRGKQNIYQIMEPICFQSCNHEVFDLYELFTEKPRIPCSKCKIKPSKDNLQIIRKEQFYSDILKNINELAYACSLIEQQVFHSYSQGVQDRARALLGKKEYFSALQEAMSHKYDMIEFFASQVQNIIHRQNSKSVIRTHIILEQPFVCLINCQKIIIPTYIKGCNHIECYEYTNLLQLIEISKEKEIKCFHDDCQNIIPLELAVFKKKIIIPIQLATAITKEHPFALTIKWNYQKSCFDDSKSQAWDVFSSKISEALQMDELSQDILITFKKIVNQEHSEYLDNKLHFSEYYVNLKGIEYPARCNQCPLQSCRDLKTFLEYEVKQMKKNNLFICPACNYWHTDYKSLDQIVYLDRYLFLAKFQQKELQPFKYNKDEQFKNYFIQYHQIKFKNVKQQYLIDKINPYQSEKCAISKTRIVDPVVIQGCKKKRVFEFTHFKKLLNEIGFDMNQFPKCECLFCSKLRLKDFSFDLFFKTILTWFQTDKLWTIETIIKKSLEENPTDFTEPKKPKIILQSPIANPINLEKLQCQQQPIKQQPQNQNISSPKDDVVFVLYNGMLIPEDHFKQITKNEQHNI